MNDVVENLIRFGEDSVREFKSIRIPGSAHQGAEQAPEDIK